MCRVVAAVGINHQLLLLPISAQLFRPTIPHNLESRTITDRLTTTGAAQSYNISPRCCTIFHNYRSARRPQYTRVSLDIVHNCGTVPSPHILILHILKRIFCSRVPAATGSNTTHNNPIMLPPPPAPVININTTETVTILKCFPRPLLQCATTVGLQKSSQSRLL